MSVLTKDILNGLGVAFNEAKLLGAEVSTAQNLGAITLSLLTLPEAGTPPEDTRIQILLSPIGRVAASLRHGRRDDPNVAVETFELHDLLKVIQSFGGLPIYGWEFIDLDEDHFKHWSDRLSLDWHGDPDGLAHSIFLFQEGSVPERILDLRIWFKDISFRNPSGKTISFEEIIAGGKRWWDGLYAGDNRTEGYGIFPGA